MHRAKRAVAAGATALAAFVLVGGPVSAVAVAKPGDSGHSHGGQHADRGGNDGPRRESRREFRRGDGDRPDNNGGDGGNGFGRGDGNNGGTAGNSGNSGSNANSGSTGRSTAAATPTTAVSRAPQAVVSNGDSESPAPTSNSTAAEVRPSSGSDIPVTAPVMVAPKATFGNGRTPGQGVRRPVLSVPQPGVTIAPPAAVVVAPAAAPLGFPRVADRPRTWLDPSVLHGWDAARPGQPMTSWFGLAGLLLIPLAGAALGYRQARAAKSASDLAIR